MYSVAILPIFVGTAMAKYEFQVFDPAVLVVFVAGAILLLAWENLCNDLFDADTGVDIHKYHSIVNLTGNKSLIWSIANLCLLGGWACIGWICWQEHSPIVAMIILICCVLGYVYQGPPWRLGYQGWGELLCLISFSLGVVASSYSQFPQFSWRMIPSAVGVGITISLVLFCSHFHQVEDDLNAGKLSPVVRLGTKRSAQLVPIICLTAYAIILGSSALGFAPRHTWLVLTSLPWAIYLSVWLNQHHDRPEVIKDSKFIALGWQFVFGLGLTAGFWL
jgi:1,4-dihydroxy-2-naphthoate phytyltransferase